MQVRSFLKLSVAVAPVSEQAFDWQRDPMAVGGMAEVFTARDRRLPREVILKRPRTFGVDGKPLPPEMANELRSFVWEVDVEPRVPSMTERPDPALLAETKRLLAFEKDDRKELRQLRKALKHGPRSSLHPLLVELMLLDTNKHIAILEFIRDHLDD